MLKRKKKQFVLFCFVFTTAHVHKGNNTWKITTCITTSMGHFSDRHERTSQAQANKILWKRLCRQLQNRVQ